MQAIIKNSLPQIRHLMRRFGVEQAYLFGSAASGTMTADSDVDFLIRFPVDMDFQTYGDNYFSLLYALQDLLKREVELVGEETISNPYLMEGINRNKLALL